MNKATDIAHEMLANGWMDKTADKQERELLARLREAVANGDVIAQAEIERMLLAACGNILRDARRQYRASVIVSHDGAEIGVNVPKAASLPRRDDSGVRDGSWQPSLFVYLTQQQVQELRAREAGKVAAGTDVVLLCDEALDLFERHPECTTVLAAAQADGRDWSHLLWQVS